MDGRKVARASPEAVAQLARQFMRLEPGSRLPTIRDLADRTGTSISWIHEVVARLERAGAIQVERRGRRGSRLASRSLCRLWDIAVGDPLVVACPLAGSLRYEALATAIKGQLTSVGIEVFLIFVRGSRQRLRAVREGRCHVAVMSAFAASELCEDEETALLELPADTFNTGHRVFYSTTREQGRRLRALVDHESVDQEGITLLEFEGTDAEFLPARHNEVPMLLESGQGDAAVWTLDEMQAYWPPGVRDRALSAHVLECIGDSDRRAALVGRAAYSDVLLAIVQTVDPAEVQRTQAEVLAGRMVPEY